MKFALCCPKAVNELWPPAPEAPWLAEGTRSSLEKLLRRLYPRFPQEIEEAYKALDREGEWEKVQFELEQVSDFSITS